MNEPGVDSTSHLIELGLLTLSAARIEFYLAAITDELVSVDAPAVGQAVTRRLQFRQLADLAEELLPVRLTDADAAHELLVPLTQWLAQARAVMTHRNNLLHSMWMLYPDERIATRVSRREHRDVPLQELCDINAQAEQVASEAGELWEQLIYLHGHFDSLIEATERMIAEDDTS